MYSALIQYIRGILPLTDGEVELIRPFLSVEKIEKGEYLIREGKVSNHLAFITEGYFRIFLNTEQEEVTIHLTGQGNFVTSLYSFITRTASRENVQAVTNAEVICISYQNLQSLYEQSHNIERLGRLMTEKHFVDKETRVIGLISDNGERRYRSLMENHPDYILNIPLQYIASYLGLKPETLSRIRSKMN